MKRILIVNNNLHIGGVQKSLLNLLHEIGSDYEITLLLFYDGGELRKDVPPCVKVISPTSPFRYWGMTRNDAWGLKDRVSRTFWMAMTRLVGRKPTLRILYPFQKKLSGYDVAISFLHSGDAKVFLGGCNEFVLNCVNAKKKVTFLHCDYGKINSNPMYNCDIYERFDVIAACSSGCRESFVKVMPQFAKKTVVVQNFHSYEKIRAQAKKDPVLLPKDTINIVTVSRFGREKGIPRAIQAIAKLGKQRDKMRYYIIGNGKEFQEAESLVQEFHLGDRVFLLGEKENPYGYMRAADMLLIPSFSEAAPMVIGEAACLGTPILSTETSSAYEMVSMTGFGWVCENSDNGITTGISKLLSDPPILRERKMFLQNKEFDDDIVRKQFSKLVL